MRGENRRTEPIYFRLATAYVRDYYIYPQLIRLSSGHRGRAIRLEKGYVIIEKEWYPKA